MAATPGATMPLPPFLDEHRQSWPVPDPAADLLTAALTRRAWCLEQGIDAPDHEPLEFLGDRVLDLVVAAELWRRFPHAEPKRLDGARQQLCSEPLLARIGEANALADSLRAGAGEHQQGQHRTDKALADHLEAVLAAAFLTGGTQEATALVHTLLADHWPDELPESHVDDQPLSALNELVQARWQRPLDKHDDWASAKSGPDNALTWQAEVTLPDGTTWQGAPVRGTLKDAKASAARKALAHLRGGQGA